MYAILQSEHRLLSHDYAIRLVSYIWSQYRVCIDNIYPLVFLVAHCVHNLGFCASVMSMWRMYHYIDIHTYITTSVHSFLLMLIHPMLKLHETVSRNVIRDLCTVEPHNNSVTPQGNHLSHLVRDIIPYMILFTDNHMTCTQHKSSNYPYIIQDTTTGYPFS